MCWSDVKYTFCESTDFNACSMQEQHAPMNGTERPVASCFVCKKLGLYVYLSSASTLSERRGAEVLFVAVRVIMKSIAA